MKAKEIINVLEKLAPPFLIDSWDNSGIQIGSIETKVRKVLISLDLSENALKKAIEENVDMILTHHPFLFGKLANISLDDNKGKMIRDIIKNDITVFTMHTNLDICEGGVNDILCETLGIEVLKPLNNFRTEFSNYDGKTYGYGRVGNLNETMTLKEFSNTVNDKLECENLRIYGDLEKNVKKIAVCGGSGSCFIKDAHLENVDVFVTGDIKYHDAQLAEELGLAMLDAGHFETEKPLVDVLKKYIEDNTNAVEVITYKESLAKFKTLK